MKKFQNLCCLMMKNSWSSISQSVSPEYQLMIWFIIKGSTLEYVWKIWILITCALFLEATKQIRSSERACCTAFVSSYVTQCFPYVVSGSLWMQNMLVTWSEGCPGTVDICGNLPSSRTTSTFSEFQLSAGLVDPIVLNDGTVDNSTKNID